MRYSEVEIAEGNLFMRLKRLRMIAGILRISSVLWIARILLAFLIGAALLVWISLLFTTNAECQRTAAATVIDYLRENRDQWPKSWEDLGDHFEKVARERNFKLTFTQLKRRVGIQWETDVESLRTASRGSQWEPPFHVIWALDGSSSIEVWNDVEPNQMIWDYLHK